MYNMSLLADAGSMFVPLQPSSSLHENEWQGAIGDLGDTTLRERGIEHLVSTRGLDSWARLL